MATVLWVQRAEETDNGYGRIGDLIARVPSSSIVSAGRDAETVVVSALAVGYKAVELVKIVRMHPWAAIVIRLSAVQQVALAEPLRYAENEPRKLVHAAVDLEEVLGQCLVILHLGVSRRAIVADFGVVRTFLGIHPLHKLRDNGVHVRVPLAVRVRRQVKRHTVEENSDVRAVVEIEAA